MSIIGMTASTETKMTMMSKYMKKPFFTIMLLMLLSLCGCSGLVSEILNSGGNIETLKSWSIQYNEGTKDYSVFFGLLDENDKYISADVDVDIRIEDESGNELYKATHTVSKDNFGYYTSKVAGEQFLAEIRIKESEIGKGTSTSGKLYLTVYKEGIVRFDEVNCEALYCLPVRSITLNANNLPVELKVKDYSGRTESIIKIEDVSYTADYDLSPEMSITISGIKIYGNNNQSYDIISYKLYDSAGYMVNSGNVFLKDLNSGDKFKDDSITVYDIKPGETYTLKFSEYGY